MVGKEEPQEKCFIIMPVTTPINLQSIYRDGKNHFQHVLDYLFMPAIVKAGYYPVPPIAKGSDFIHASIIKSLESAEIVLCDMSSLNPNVFFELGIRTSLNKPVCIVKDEITSQVPFDMSILNYSEYESALDPWNLTKEIDKIASHIKISVERSKGENTLWTQLGFKSKAIPYITNIDDNDKLNYITYQLDSIKERMQNGLDTQQPSVFKSPKQSEVEKRNQLAIYIKNFFLREDVNVDEFRIAISPAQVFLDYEGHLTPEQKKFLNDYVTNLYSLQTVFRTMMKDKEDKPYFKFENEIKSKKKKK